MSIKTRKRYNEEFKVEAVKLVTARGYSLTQAAKSLGVSVDSISKWKKSIVTMYSISNQLGPPLLLLVPLSLHAVALFDVHLLLLTFHIY